MDLIKLFKTLADETRLRIIRIFFNGFFNVNEALFIVGGKQANVSHHLKVLTDSNLLISKKEGKEVYYRLNSFDTNNTVKLFFKLIKNEVKNIPNYMDDMKRIEYIIQKRTKKAEVYFNAIGEEYEIKEGQVFGAIYSVTDALELLNGKQDVILDLGCGTGRNLPILSKYARKVMGIDNSPKMINLSEHICKSNDLNYELKIGDSAHLPIDNESIDTVFINMMLHHISDPEIVINEVNRILKKGGNLLLIDLLSHNDDSFRESYADLWLGFSFEEITIWLNKCGFEIKKELLKENKLNGKSKGDDDKKVFIILAVKKNPI
jgi:ubiquinone/menaquinone biosynthesis C-methylase UbiE/DNA-binding transcriptional ArsR family regulator